MSTVHFKVAFVVCFIVLSRLLYLALVSVEKYRASRRSTKVAKFNRAVNWPGPENGDHVLEVPMVNQLRRRPSSQRVEYPLERRGPT